MRVCRQAEKWKDSDLTFIKVDIDEAEDISEACGVEQMPTFQLYKNGRGC